MTGKNNDWLKYGKYGGIYENQPNLTRHVLFKRIPNAVMYSLWYLVLVSVCDVITAVKSFLDSLTRSLAEYIILLTNIMFGIQFFLRLCLVNFHQIHIF